MLHMYSFFPHKNNMRLVLLSWFSVVISFPSLFPVFHSNLLNGVPFYSSPFTIQPSDYILYRFFFFLMWSNLSLDPFKVLPNTFTRCFKLLIILCLQLTSSASSDSLLSLFLFWWNLDFLATIITTQPAFLLYPLLPLYLQLFLNILWISP